jgi:hypothetical protein
MKEELRENDKKISKDVEEQKENQGSWQVCISHLLR